MVSFLIRLDPMMRQPFHRQPTLSHFEGLIIHIINMLSYRMQDYLPISE